LCENNLEKRFNDNFSQQHRENSFSDNYSQQHRENSFSDNYSQQNVYNSSVKNRVNKFSGSYTTSKEAAEIVIIKDSADAT
jgi:hypothetical protein